MLKLKLDENLGKKLAEPFDSAGFDVETMYDEFLNGAPDTRIIETCLSEQRCLVTLDMDFSNTVLFPPDQCAGIVILRFPKTPGSEDILKTIHFLIPVLKNENNLFGKLWIVRENRIRVYQPKK